MQGYKLKMLETNNRRFIFIIPFRNAGQFIYECARSLQLQTYSNWRAFFANDASTDKSCQMIPNDDRFTIINHQTRLFGLENIHQAIVASQAKNDDIICILDGDDALLRYDAIDIINQLYVDDVMLTYGQYACLDGVIGHCRPYAYKEFKKLRKAGHRASHLKTFSYSLYNKLLALDPTLSHFKDQKGAFYRTATDVALMTPLMELAGFERIKFNPEPIYFYRLHNDNVHHKSLELQKKTAEQIFAKCPIKS